MTNTKIRDMKTPIYISFLLYLLGVISFMAFVNKVSLIDGCVFFLFQFACILLPGTALVLTLVKETEALNLLIFSYMAGYILNIISYFIFMLLGIIEGSLFLFITLDIYSIYLLKKRYKTIKKTEYAHWGVWGIFVFLLTILALIVYTGNNLLPIAVQENAYYTDLLYWIGDTAELSHTFPPRHFRDVSQPYYYHYFSSVQLALANRITNINVAELSLVFAPVQSVVLLVSSAFLLLKDNIRHNTLLYTIIGMFVLFFTTGNEADTSVNYVSHMHKAPFGFDISMAFGMFTLLFLIKQIRETKFNLFCYIMSCLSYFVCLGTKGSTGVIVLCILGIFCLYYFFVKKQYRIAFIYGSTFLITFILLYWFILVSKSASVASTLNLSDGYGRLANNGYIGGFFNDLYYEKGIPWVITRIVQTIYYYFICHYGVATIFFLGIIFRLINYKKIDYIDIACTVIPLMGCILTLIVVHPTFSQTYFVMATYPAALLFGLRSCSDFHADIVKKNKNLKRIVSIAQFLIISIGILVGTNSFFSCYYYKLAYKIGIANYKKDSESILEISKTSMYNYVSSEDYKAYVWIRENTKWEDLFTSNLCLDGDIVRPYCLGAFSERHILMKDIDLITDLMNNETRALNEIKENGISYIVWYKHISPDFKPGKLMLERVFNNENIAIYQIN